MDQTILSNFKKELGISLDALKERLSGVRTSRATPALLESLTVDAYGGRMPLSQVSTVSVPEPRTLVIQVWDATLVSAVGKALLSFGMNPATEGSVLRVHLPELTQERRKEFVKMAKDHAENSRIGIRNVRRDCLDHISKDDFSEDALHALKKDIQKLTDDAIAQIDRFFAEKEKEILKV
jgi:ribosome recycling factor